MSQGHRKSILRKRSRSHKRIGSIYIVAMGTSLIVACLALASLQAVRVQRRVNDSLSQVANAKKLAQAGIEFVQQRILTDASWRTYFTNGTSVTRTTTGGSFSVTLTDPDDSNIANQTIDPILVTSTGTFGASSQKMTAYLEPQTQLIAACRSALYSPSEIKLDNCTISANQWAMSDVKISTSGNPIINMNCLAATLASNSSYKQRAIQGGSWPMDNLDMSPTSSSYVGKYYSDNGVTINAGDLPTGGTQLIKNGGFETNIANWTAVGCTLTRSTSQKQTGNASCYVSNQNLFTSYPAQVITEHMLKGRNYTVSFWVRSNSDQDFYPKIVLTCSGSALPIVLYGGSVSVDEDVWTLVSRTINVSWSGTLTKAEFQIENTKPWVDYYFDDASLLNADRVAGTRYIENVILGNTTNPYGSGTVSASGMYSISVPGEKLLIRDCRVNATIVVSASSKVELDNAISWEPIGRNFPALIANAPIDDLTSDTSLIESTIGVNLNPASTPYNGTSDTDVSDSYPSVIKGAIVSTGNVLLGGLSALNGPIVSSQKITVTSTGLTISFPSDMILNPPPSFCSDPPLMRLIPSSLQSMP